eukprot:scaffold60075_cov31-Tisochrysis_lutea.AAC.1
MGVDSICATAYSGVETSVQHSGASRGKPGFDCERAANQRGFLLRAGRPPVLLPSQPSVSSLRQSTNEKASYGTPPVTGSAIGWERATMAEKRGTRTRRRTRSNSAVAATALADEPTASVTDRGSASTGGGAASAVRRSTLAEARCQPPSEEEASVSSTTSNSPRATSAVACATALGVSCSAPGPRMTRSDHLPEGVRVTAETRVPRSTDAVDAESRARGSWCIPPTPTYTGSVREGSPKKSALPPAAEERPSLPSADGSPMQMRPKRPSHRSAHPASHHSLTSVTICSESARKNWHPSGGSGSRSNGSGRSGGSSRSNGKWHGALVVRKNPPVVCAHSPMRGSAAGPSRALVKEREGERAAR